MYGVISVKGLGGYAFLNEYARGRSAVSSVALVARDMARRAVNLTEESRALFGRRSEALAALTKIGVECAEADWDGYGASAIAPEAVRNAVAFVHAFPPDLPLPAFAPEPDGEISLDWIVSRTRMFSVSLGSDPRLPYAWLDGSDKGHGVTCFDGERIPSRVLQGIREIVKDGTVAIRSF